MYVTQHNIFFRAENIYDEEKINVNIHKLKTILKGVIVIDEILLYILQVNIKLNEIENIKKERRRQSAILEDTIRIIKNDHKNITFTNFKSINSVYKILKKSSLKVSVSKNHIEITLNSNTFRSFIIYKRSTWLSNIYSVTLDCLLFKST